MCVGARVCVYTPISDVHARRLQSYPRRDVSWLASNGWAHLGLLELIKSNGARGFTGEERRAILRVHGEKHHLAGLKSIDRPKSKHCSAAR